MSKIVSLPSSASSLPAILQRAGANAAFATEEFFGAKINNVHTRRAYGR